MKQTPETFEYVPITEFFRRLIAQVEIADAIHRLPYTVPNRLKGAYINDEGDAV